MTTVFQTNQRLQTPPSPDVLKMPPCEFLYALSVVHYGPRRPCYRQQIARKLRIQSNNNTEMTFKGHSRSSEMSRVDRAHMISY